MQLRQRRCRSSSVNWRSDPPPTPPTHPHTHTLAFTRCTSSHVFFSFLSWQTGLQWHGGARWTLVLSSSRDPAALADIWLTCLHLHPRSSTASGWAPPDPILQHSEIWKTSVSNLSAELSASFAGPPLRNQRWTQYSWERITTISDLFTVSCGSRSYFVVDAVVLLFSQWIPNDLSTSPTISTSLSFRGLFLSSPFPSTHAASHRLTQTRGQMTLIKG